ncbi:MAG TPA: WG repeat-containing protein [Chryseolinea sp.]|nr:WG repeat-containing protein [Chryseolinea sp.]HPH45455.1 WG repeat-containing protein [Chryseolinea sp.]HPM29357.1 WG repeat-containing protein [Chryseolinea sp.]
MKCASSFFWCLLISFFSTAAQYSVFEENGKVGLKNDQGKVLIPAQHEAIGWSDAPFSMLGDVTGYKIKGKWGLINLSNHRITKAEYEELFPGDPTLIIARKKSTVSLRIVSGCISLSGKEVIPFEYDGIKIVSLRAIVFTKIGNQFKYGLIDLTNRTLVPQQYKSIRPLGSLRYAIENFEAKTALFSDNGKQITQFSIDSISSFKQNVAITYQNLQQGLIDRDGFVKAEATYREIKINDDGKVFARMANEWFFLDGKATVKKTFRADSIIAVDKNRLQLITAGKISLVDDQLIPIAKSQFDYLGKFENGKAIFSADNKCGVISEHGIILIQPKFNQLKSDGNFLIAQNNAEEASNWILLDVVGNPLESKTYENMLPFNGSFFPVSKRNFWGGINTSGTEIIACVYDSLIQVREGNIVVKFRGQYGIINQQEEWLVTPRANTLKLLTNDRFMEFTQTHTYLKSFDGNVIYFTENKIDVRSGTMLEYLPSGTIWEIDLNGIIVNRQVQPEGSIEKIFEETEGLRGMKKNGQYGFVDSRGRLRIANRYDGIKPFQQNLAAIKIRGKWGFINHDDKIVIQPIFDEVSSFENGFSFVKQKGLFGLIDLNGKQILHMRYNRITPLNNGYLLIEQEKLMGLADMQGKVWINPKYDHLMYTSDGYVIIERNGKYGVITRQGLSTIPLIYDGITYDSFSDSFLAMKKAEWTEIK